MVASYSLLSLALKSFLKIDIQSASFPRLSSLTTVCESPSCSCCSSFRATTHHSSDVHLSLFQKRSSRAREFSIRMQPPLISSRVLFGLPSKFVPPSIDFFSFHYTSFVGMQLNILILNFKQPPHHSTGSSMCIKKQ